MRADDPASDAVCFHFQQAVEKMLKAWLGWRDQPFPKTHSISALVAQCERLDPEFSALRSLEILTDYAVEVRYGDEPYFPTEEEMREAAKLAERTESFLKERFLREGLELTQ
jgi:HEPN domain-containing protein